MPGPAPSEIALMATANYAAVFKTVCDCIAYLDQMPIVDDEEMERGRIALRDHFRAVVGGELVRVAESAKFNDVIKGFGNNGQNE